MRYNCAARVSGQETISPGSERILLRGPLTQSRSWDLQTHATSLLGTLVQIINIYAERIELLSRLPAQPDRRRIEIEKVNSDQTLLYCEYLLWLD